MGHQPLHACCFFSFHVGAVLPHEQSSRRCALCGMCVRCAPAAAGLLLPSPAWSVQSGGLPWALLLVVYAWRLPVCLCVFSNLLVASALLCEQPLGHCAEVDALPLATSISFNTICSWCIVGHHKWSAMHCCAGRIARKKGHGFRQLALCCA